MEDLGKSGLGVQKHRISCQNITMRVRMCIPAVLTLRSDYFPTPNRLSQIVYSKPNYSRV